MKKHLNLFIFLFFILGILGGIIIPKIMLDISVIGALYLNALKFMIIPILFTTIALSISNNVLNKNTKILKLIRLFVLMFVVTFTISFALLQLAKPLLSTHIVTSEYVGDLAKISFASFIENIFPSNPLDIITKTNVLAVIIISVLFGYALAKTTKKERTIELLENIHDAFNNMLELILLLSPLGVFSLIGTSIATNGLNVITSSLIYILAAYLLSIIIIGLMIIYLRKMIKPKTYISKLSKVWLMAISTCSSIATLPYALKVCKEELIIDPKTTDLVVPLGTTINKVGGAISFALLSVFTTQLYGIEVTIPIFLLMLLFSLLLNMAAAGIPSGGIVLGATYLSMLGIPLSFIGIYSGFYRLLDMAYTTLNVTGNINAAIIVNNQKLTSKKK